MTVPSLSCFHMLCLSLCSHLFGCTRIPLMFYLSLCMIPPVITHQFDPLCNDFSRLQFWSVVHLSPRTDQFGKVNTLPLSGA